MDKDVWIVHRTSYGRNRWSGRNVQMMGAYLSKERAEEEARKLTRQSTALDDVFIDDVGWVERTKLEA